MVKFKLFLKMSKIPIRQTVRKLCFSLSGYFQR